MKLSVNGTFQITKNTFNSSEMGFRWGINELACLIHREGNVRSSESHILKSTYNASVDGRIREESSCGI